MTVHGFSLINTEAAFLMYTEVVSWPPMWGARVGPVPTISRQLDRDAETRTLLTGHPHSWACSPHSMLMSRHAVLGWDRVEGGFVEAKLVVCVCTQACPTLYDPMDSVGHQTPLSMEFPRQEYWSGLLFPSAGDLPDPGIEADSPASLALQAETREALRS